MVNAIKVPLCVEVKFTTKGDIVPLKIIVNDKQFNISKVLTVKKFPLQTFGYIAPIEYSIVIGNVQKKIYYEQSTSCWFSVRQV